MSNSKKYLEEKLFEDGLKYFGIKDKKLSIDVVNIWHYDKENLNHRWTEIENFNDHKGKILDMACGVGTFLFHGLHKGYDVYGIEPEKWKITYMNMKIDELNYPTEWRNKIFEGIGEKLPFKNETFDYIGSYQTLEHVQNIEACLDEMVRVLKIGGKIKIQAPDYESFFEPHYLLPFLPKMNKKLATYYLNLMKRPTLGLNTLTWTTNKLIINYLRKYKNLEIIDLYSLYKNRKINTLKNKYKLPNFLSVIIINLLYYKNIYLCKEEKQINIIVKKVF